MGHILIQPTIQSIDSYVAYAEANHFAFEIVDFAFPQSDNTDFTRIAEQYLVRDSRKLYLSMHGAFIDLYINSPEPGIQKVSKDRILVNMEIARLLNLRYVVFHTNRLPLIRHEGYRANWV